MGQSTNYTKGVFLISMTILLFHGKIFYFHDNQEIQINGYPKRLFCGIRDGSPWPEGPMSRSGPAHGPKGPCPSGAFGTSKYPLITRYPNTKFIGDFYSTDNVQPDTTGVLFSMNICLILNTSIPYTHVPQFLFKCSEGSEATYLTSPNSYLNVQKGANRPSSHPGRN